MNKILEGFNETMNSAIGDYNLKTLGRLLAIVVILICGTILIMGLGIGFYCLLDWLLNYIRVR